jgi:signal transduction histidine kinase
MELEALSNMGRHSGATTCRVSILSDASAAVIQIDDDARGFDADSASRGMGMVPL